MKKILLLLCLSVGFFSCKDEYDLPDQPLSNYIKVYMPLAVNNPVSTTLEIVDDPQIITYGACYGGQDYPTEDIRITFKVSANLIDSFNLANGTSYELLPATGYTLSSMEAVIPKGKLNTDPLRINVTTKGDNAIDALKDYVLPISIEQSSIVVNEPLRTTFYVIKAQPKFEDYPNFDRSNWAIAGFSSEEANGEGANNGHAKHTIDADNSTFWHSQWQGASPGPPHYIIYDMGEVKEVHGLGFLARQNGSNGKPSAVSIETSIDNVTWTPAGNMELQNTQDLQKRFLAGFKDARYIKVVINSAFSASYAHLAELYAF